MKYLLSDDIINVERKFNLTPKLRNFQDQLNNKV